MTRKEKKAALIGIAKSVSDNEFADFRMDANIIEKYLKNTNLYVLYKERDGIMEVDVRPDNSKIKGSHSCFYDVCPTKNDFIYCLVSAIEELFKLTEDYDKRKNSI